MYAILFYSIQNYRPVVNVQIIHEQKQLKICKYFIHIKMKNLFVFT